MKKILVLVLFTIMCFSLCACGGEEPTCISDGNVITVDNEYSFEVEGWGYGDTIEGEFGTNSTYSYSPIDHVAYIELDYKNLSSEKIDNRDAFGGEEMEGELVINETSYAINTYLPEDIAPLGNGPVYIYYTVPSDIIKGDGDKIATFKIGEILYQYNMGAENSTIDNTELPEGVSIEKAPEAVEVKNGDILKEDGLYECVVKGANAGSKISDGSGNITYSYSPNGGHAIWIELDFKNLSSDLLEEFNCDLFSNIEMTYDNKYNYKGGVWFANDIPALSSANVFIYFEAPKEAFTGEGSKVATFEIGDTEYVYNF